MKGLHIPSLTSKIFFYKEPFLHDGESSWCVRISIAVAESNSNNVGPKQRPLKPIVRSVIFARPWGRK